MIALSRVHRSKQFVILFLLVGTAGHAAERNSDEEPAAVEAFRSLLMARRQFVPSEGLIVDRCSLSPHLNASQIDSLISLTYGIKFRGCGSEAAVESNDKVWELSGVIYWWPSSIISADVRVPSGRMFHRERYVMREHYLAELTMSHYGVYD